MKKVQLILSLVIAVLAVWSCRDNPVAVQFDDTEQMTIYDYILKNKDQYSDFLRILEKGGLDKTLSAYNPNGAGYTLFLPDNAAIERYVANSGYSSVEDLVNDVAFDSVLSRFHAVNMGISSNDFPFGALPERTLSEDYLTVSFIIETDTSYYVINNEAVVVKPDIETSNGIIHLVNEMLIPVTNTTYDWLSQNAGYSIFKAAVDITGLQQAFDINTKDKVTKPRPFTLLLEADTVFAKKGIHTISDLEHLISPNDQDYTAADNPLKNFVFYHMITESRFINDFLNVATNYTTYSEIPLNINGTGLDILINKGKQMFDTIVDGQDSTFIDFIGLNYDASNVLTQSGVIHFIDQIMQQVKPSRAIQNFEFFEEPLLNEYRLEQKEYIIEDTAALNTIKWKGADLTFVKTNPDNTNAWNGDYLLIDGDFSISYTIPKMVQGSYTAYLQADAYNRDNALIQVYIDGKQIGKLIDLTTGGSSAQPFFQIELGPVNFQKYEGHVIEIKSLIPGRFAWDYIRFEPL
jgi:uncharacterized surface protein with fasciclin (FAS1) repeats